MNTKKITRTELYELVWQKPMIHLARELHLSDVGLAKICKKYDIPRPPRGYWAQLQHNWHPKKTPLPEGENATINFDLEENQRRREQSESTATKTVQVKKENKELLGKPLHPLAERVEKILETATPGKDGRVKINRVNTPFIHVSPSCRERLVNFLSALGHGAEKRGMKLASGNKEDGLRFESREDVLNIRIEEDLEEYELEPTEEQKRQPAWTWNNKRMRPCGKMRVQITSPQRTRGRCKWTESSTIPLIHHLAPVLARMESVFEWYENKREETRRREREYEESERRYEERRRQNEHVEALNEEYLKRQLNLIRAATQYQQVKHIEEFKEACIEHWGGASHLNEDQKEWVAYAGRVAAFLHPFHDGYPDPVKDRSFDHETIPVGGPYPECEEFPLPFELMELERIVKREQSSSYYSRTW